MSDRDSFRIGHSDRDRAADDLRQAHTEGRLTDEELQKRLEQVAQAKTVGDVKAIFADLPDPIVGPLATPASLPVAPTPAEIREPGYTPSDPLILSAVFSPAKRSGPWVVPPYVRAHAIMSQVTFDCLLATAVTSVIDVEVLPGADGVLWVIPEGWAVDVSRLSVGIGGSIKSTVSVQPSWGHPLIVARGSLGLGRFRARYANSRERRRNRLNR